MAKTKRDSLVIGAGPDKCFWTADGRVLRNLFDLSKAFEEISEETYRHHVRDGNNDFGNWVHHVFGEKRLADRLAKADSREKSQVAVLKHTISVLTKKH